MKAGSIQIRPERVLAVDPTGKGFGFAVLEGPELLVDWGVKRAKDDRICLERVAALIIRYQPEVMVVERANAPGCQRRLRARRLIENLLVLARDHRVRVRQVSRQSVQRYFGASRPATKRQIALALVMRFPELGPYLPPERKPWMCENERMGIFDAVAFACKFYEPFRHERHAIALLDEPVSFPHA
jgi:hypothetical protein